MTSPFHGPVGLLIVQLVVILTASRLLGLVTRKLRQPLVIAEVVAGIMLGPSLFGWLAPNAFAVFFPASSLNALKMLSQVGLLLFMFLVGLELDPKLLRGRGRVSVAISHTSIIAPFALGALAAPFLYARLSSTEIPFVPFMLFMGISMSVTAFPVLARILTESRLLKTEIGALSITCAAVDDVSAWCLLAFVVSTARSGSIGGAAMTTILALGYAALMLVVVRPYVAKLAARISNREGLNQGVVALTLVCLLLSSLATEMIGIHALFGAFLFGAIIPRGSEFGRLLTEKIEDVAVVLLLPVFFAYSGLRTEIGLLSTPSSWAICGLIILLACAGKFGGSVIAARLSGLPWRESSAIGILMNTRGLMELVVLNIGLDLGIISPTLFTMMVVMALATTFMTSPILRWIYPGERAREFQPTGSAVPFRVLASVWNAQSGPGLAVLASSLSRSSDEPLYALHLHEPHEEAESALNEAPEKNALEPLLARSMELGVETRPISFVSNEPAIDICRTAEAKGAGLVVLGWDAHELNGSTWTLLAKAKDVMKEAVCDVAILIDRGLVDVQRILVPCTGSAHDRAALLLARRLMENGRAEVTVLDITDSSQKPNARASRQSIVNDVFSEGSSAVRFATVDHASPEEAVLEESRNSYDLIILGVGTDWERSPEAFGRNREKLIREAATSVIVVHHAEAPAVSAIRGVPEAALSMTG